MTGRSASREGWTWQRAGTALLWVLVTGGALCFLVWFVWVVAGNHPKVSPFSEHDEGPRMVRIPGGTFQTGGLMPTPFPEIPRRWVTVKAFYMDQTEVTVDQYGRCVDAGVCKPADVSDLLGDPTVDPEAANQLCNFRHRAARGRHPINCVDLTMAATFCRWARKRLPSADEWEYGARGTDGRDYPWGNQPPSPRLLNAQGVESVHSSAIGDIRHQPRDPFPTDDGYVLTAPVGSFPEGRSPFGLFDMAGNVCEFDWSGVTHGSAWSSGLPAITHSAWYNGLTSFPWAASNIGFRCARDIAESSQASP